MAYVNSRSLSVTLADRFGSAFKVVKEAMERRRVYNQTVVELGSLTDRDLADLGIARMTISDVAYEAAYRK
ncbi:MAG: DUF1127 domain-containing protein [bacterium]